MIAFLKGACLGFLMWLIATIFASMLGILREFNSLFVLALPLAPLVGGILNVVEEGKDRDQTATRERVAAEGRQKSNEREAANRKALADMDNRQRQERKARLSDEMSEFKDMLETASSARKMGVSSRLRDELAKAERNLEHEWRQNQQAFAQANGTHDPDLGRRCIAITDAIEDEIKKLRQQLSLLEASL